MHKEIKTKGKADTIDIHIGKTLKSIRILNGYSQEYVANDIDVSFQQLQKYERGVNRISASRMYALSKTLNVDISEFFKGLDPENECPKLRVITSADEQALKLLAKFRKIKNPQIKKSILTLLKESTAE